MHVNLMQNTNSNVNIGFLPDFLRPKGKKFRSFYIFFFADGKYPFLCCCEMNGFK